MKDWIAEHKVLKIRQENRKLMVKHENLKKNSKANKGNLCKIRRLLKKIEEPVKFK